jgi:dihydrofolate reductase/thymidylate synthase
MSKQIHLIVALDRANGIGLNNSIPWKCREDMAHFRTTTNHSVVIMGRKTWESIGCKPLPNRSNIVVSKSIPPSEEGSLRIVASPEDIDLKSIDKPIFIIGGATVYEWFLSRNLVDTLIITRIRNTFECDTFLHMDMDYWKAQSSKRLNVDVVCNGYVEDTDIAIETYVPHNPYESELLTLMRDVCVSGDPRMERTGHGAKSLFGEQLVFSLRNNRLPLMTTRMSSVKIIMSELMFILKGLTDARWLHTYKNHIWDANTTRDFLDKQGLRHLDVFDLGASYGFQMRHFGAKYVDCHTDYTGQGCDQLMNVVHSLRTNPTSRRHIITLYNPDQLHETVLPPCGYSYQWFVRKNKYLSCKLVQRSSDLAVAGHFNVTSASLLTIILAKICGYEPYELVWSVGDVHVYNNHIDMAMEQQTRTPHAYPFVYFDTDSRDPSDIRWMESMRVVGYRHQGTLKYPMNP